MTNDDSYKKDAVFFSDNIDPDIVFDVLEDKTAQMMFAGMIRAIQQISTDSEVDIKITAEGVLFSSMNSYETGPLQDGMQTNVATVKQSFVRFDQVLSPDDLSKALSNAIKSMIIYNEEFLL